VDRTRTFNISPRLGNVDAWTEMLLNLPCRLVAKAASSNSLYSLSNLKREYIGLSIESHSGCLLYATSQCYGTEASPQMTILSAGMPEDVS